MSDPIVGIDLGTSNTVVAHASTPGLVTVLADDAGSRIHPSVVSFHPSGGVVVGAAAKQRRVIDPQNTIYSVKRLIGRSYHAPEVQTAKARAPFLIKEGPSSAPVIATRGGEFAVPEISAIVLDHVRNVAAARLERPVERAVVTVPASFNDAQRSATATAGAIAGLTVVRVLNEPTAAALAYGHSRSLREIIAVYDFGGGTFDITFLRLEDQVYEVLGTSGDTFLGGDDFDERLVDKMVARFLAETRVDLRSNEVAMMRLRAVAEQTKIELSRRSRAIVRVDEIAYGARGAPLNLQVELSRDEFVRDIADLVDRTFPVCSEALALANLTVDRISDVILVGGSTRIPYVREQVSKFFAKAPRTDINPEEAVASGAALQATSLERILARRSSSKLSALPRPGGDLPAAGPSEAAALGGPGVAVAVGSPEVPVSPPPPPRARRPTAEYGGLGARGAAESPRPESPDAGSRSGARLAGSIRELAASAAAVEPLPRASATIVAPPPVPAAPTIPASGRHADPLSGRTAASGPMAGAMLPSVPLGTVPGVGGGSAGAALLPELELDLGSAGSWEDVPGLERLELPERPATQVGLASPPPVPTAGPRRASASRPPVPAAAQPPPLPGRRLAGELPPLPEPRDSSSSVRVDAAAAPMRRPDASEGPARPARLADAWPEASSDGRADAWPGPSPAAAAPTSPAVPMAPPTAPTLIAPASELATPPIAAEPRPAMTARGFQAPRSAVTEPAEAPAGDGRALPPAAVVAPVELAPAPVLLEVLPRGLGIATVAGYCEELVRRNARLPAEARKLFTTSRDHQDSVRIVVCQGESRRLESNTVIGDLVLAHLPPRPRGETSIEVTFAIDASGVLQVRARDSATGVEQRATLVLVGDVAPEHVAASRDRLAQLRR